MRAKVAAVVLGTIWLCAAPQTRAALGVRMPLTDLVRNADKVVRGTIANSKSYLDEKTGRIFTRHTLQVSHYLRGSGAQEITVVTMGGELEDIGQMVPGEARFFAGEEVVLCLKNRKKHFVPMGMSQGKFRVEKLKGKLTLVRDLSGIKFLGEKEDSPRKKAQKIPYQQFIQLIEGATR